MKRNFRRFANIATATLLAACITAPMATGLSSSAAKDTITIKDQGDSVEHTYTLYQLFSGDVDTANIGTTTSTLGSLKGVKWAWAPAADADDDAIAASNKMTTDFITALNASGLVTVAADADAATVATAIKDFTTTTDATSGAVSENTENTKKFAQWLGTNANLLKKVDTTSENTFACAADGYYIIVESKLTGQDGSMTYHLLGTYNADNGADISVKASKPSVLKKVKEDDKTGTWEEADKYGAQYNDVADYTKGDMVPFRLIATLPSDIDVYDNYYIKYTDSLDKGFVAPETFKVTIDGATATSFDVPITDGEGTADGGNIKVTATANATTGGTDIIVEVINVQKYKDAATTNDSLSGTTVTVDYEAKFDTDAIVGRPGNYNDVYLTYSNNPNSTGDGTTAPSDEDLGQTDKDGVVVFTYELDVYKYDGANESDGRLAGAQFVLSTKNAEGKTVYLNIDDTTKVYSWKEVDTSVADFTWADAGVEIFTSVKDKDIIIPGLDDGTYTLTEIAAPGGFNIGGPWELVITATTANGQNHDAIGPNADTDSDGEGDGRTGEQLTEIVLTSNGDPADTNANGGTLNESEAGYDDVGGTLLEEGNVQVKIENNSGAQLPGTGGIGTTLFYLGGGAMVAIGGIYLISKKRANGAQE